MNIHDITRQAFGQPLPSLPHAVSVSMPRWADVVAYEEGQPEALGAMRCGYPRFFLHPLYRELRARYQSEARAGETVWVFPSLRVAMDCTAFVGTGRVRGTPDGVALALVPRELDDKARKFWQHTGWIVSSRQAECILTGRAPAPHQSLQHLRQMVAGHYGIEPQDVLLMPSGMAAVHTAHSIVGVSRPGTAVQLGFPYLDTLKLLEAFGVGRYLPYLSPSDIDALAGLMDVSAVFCEVPGNPLLRTIDLAWLRATVDAPLVVDDTLGTPINIDVMPWADIVVTSLTKFFSGVGDAMGGALILNRASPWYPAFARELADHEELLFPDDALVLAANGSGFIRRMTKINANTRALAAHLRRSPLVAKVHYPEGDPAFEAIRRPGGGHGGLLSLVLRDESLTPHFYDCLRVAKGPSLGTDFTLACPYTLLAHYSELDWAASQGVPAHLVRVSVGCEDAILLAGHFDEALARIAPP